MSNSFISSTSKQKKSRENKMPSQYPLQAFQTDQKDNKIDIIPQLNLTTLFNESQVHNNTKFNQSRSRTDQMNISMGKNSYFNNNITSNHMDSKKITFNEIDDNPLKQSQNLKSLATSNMQESLLQDNLQYSSKFNQQNQSLKQSLGNQQTPQLNIIQQSNSPYNQLVEENYALKNKLQDTLYQKEQLEVKNQELFSQVQKMQLQIKNLTIQQEQTPNKKTNEQRLNYYVEILDSKNSKIQELMNEIKNLESKLLQVSQRQQPQENQNFQSQKFKSLMNKFDPLVQSNLNQAQNNNETYKKETMIIKVEKPTYQREQSFSYEQTPKRDYKVSQINNTKRIIQQDQNEVRTLYSKNSCDESFKYSLPRRANNTSTTYYKVPTNKYQKQAKDEYGSNYKYSTNRQENQYVNSYNKKINGTAYNNVSSRYSLQRQTKDSYKSQEPRVIKRIKISNSPVVNQCTNKQCTYREYSVANKRLPRYID